MAEEKNGEWPFTARRLHFLLVMGVLKRLPPADQFWSAHVVKMFVFWHYASGDAETA